MTSKEELRILVADQEKRYTLGGMCAAAFRSLGHTVALFDVSPIRVPFLGWELNQQNARENFVQQANSFDPDLVFVIKGNNLPTEYLRRIKDRTGALLCNWNPDNPYAARSTSRRLETYLTALPVYDHIFIWSEELFEPLSQAGAQSVQHLPFAHDPAIHQPVAPDSEYQSEVVFVGSWSPKRETYLSMISKLDIDLAIYGNGWKHRCWDWSIRQNIRDDAVYGVDYSKALCSAEIALNIVPDHNLNAYNMKSFEIPATETFMLTSRTELQQSIYGEDEGIVCFDDAVEATRKIERYLDDPNRRAEIAETGTEIVQSHIYKKRMESVLANI